MQIELPAKLSNEGFPIAWIELRKAGATADVPGCPVWAIIDTAAARSFIHPGWMHNVPGLVATNNKFAVSSPFANDEVKTCNVSLWLPAQGEKQAIKLLDPHALGIVRVKVQTVLIGKDLLSRGELRVNWTTKEVRLVLDFPVAG
jgi:hypothetical protein